MSFDNLPTDWPQRPLTDPQIGADVVDLVVRDIDRATGALAFLLCHEDGSLAQPVVVGGHADDNRIADDGWDTFVPDQDDLVAAVRQMTAVIADLPDTPAFVLAIARPHGPVQDADRRLHQLALEQARKRGLILLGTYLATHAGVTHLPVATGLRPHRGAA